MAAKSKKRLSKIENKLLKLDKLEIKDVICSICQSILIEPVTLPCFHYFCYHCFNGSVENNSLCCPLCRLRIGSWLRNATKQKNLVNTELWNFIKSKFSLEIDTKLNGGDLQLPQDKPSLRLSAPGEIRSEYEAELKRLKAERLALEQKQFHETEELIIKIQREEQEAQKRYQERLKQDEILAQQIQKEHPKVSVAPTPRKLQDSTKPRLKPTKIDNYLSKRQATPANVSPLLTDDNTNSTNSDTSTPKATVKPISRPSPEMVPSYGKILKNFIDKKIKTGTGFWNKENGDKDKNEDPQPSHKEIARCEDRTKIKNGIKSLPVSLPLPPSGIPHCVLKKTLPDIRNLQTGSVDSMHQELCFFKPIERTTPMSMKRKALPLRVPGVRPDAAAVTGEPPRPEADAPSRDNYVEGLCRLRSLSLAHSLPSAFVIALNMLRVNKEIPVRCGATTRSRIKRTAPTIETSLVKTTVPSKTKQAGRINGYAKSDRNTTLRRTRSMGSLKDENETTPKKNKVQERKVTSDRKPYLRSDSKNMSTKKRLSSPPLTSEKINNNKVNLAVKNLSSPLKNCDVKHILQEQLRIEKIIEQEKTDLELALRMDAEWNSRRQPRRSAVKRQATLSYALRPTKKLKV